MAPFSPGFVTPYRLLPCLAALLFAASASSAQVRGPEKGPGMESTAPPGLVIEEPHTSFPDAFQLTTITRTFRFSNRGPREVVIQEGLGIKEGARVTFSPSRVPPGAGGTVQVEQDLGAILGATSFRFAIITDEPGVARYRMSLSGFVLSAYTPELPLASFGRLARGQEAERAIELFSREVDRLEVRRVEGAPAFLHVDVGERAGLAGEGLVVRLRLQGRPPLGLSTGQVTLWTNVETQPRYVVNYTAEVFGDVEPDAHPLSFELVRMGEPKTIDVQLRSRSGNAFEVKGVTDSLGVVDVDTEPCPGTGPGPSPCVILHATAGVEGPMNLAGVLDVHIGGDPEPLPLRYGGWVISPNTVVRQLGDAGADTIFAGAGAGASSSPLGDSVAPASAADTPRTAVPPAPVAPRTPAPSPTPSAPAPAVSPNPSVSPTPAAAPKAAPEAPGTRGTRIAWKSRNDESLYGYIVYRADKEIGPFRRVSDVIRTKDAPDVAHEYEFRDTTARPGRTYFYYLDTVSQRGLTERFSPVRAATAPGP